MTADVAEWTHQSSRIWSSGRRFTGHNRDNCHLCRDVARFVETRLAQMWGTS